MLCNTIYPLLYNLWWIDKIAQCTIKYNNSDDIAVCVLYAMIDKSVVLFRFWQFLCIVYKVLLTKWKGYHNEMIAIIMLLLELFNEHLT